jgi:hypothetical protein
MDIAPKYSSTATGLMNTGSAFAETVSPLMKVVTDQSGVTATHPAVREAYIQRHPLSNAGCADESHAACELAISDTLSPTVANAPRLNSWL